MIIGIPKEIKTSENRVGITEAGVRQLVKEGHQLLVEKEAGIGSYIQDTDYQKAGATLIEKKEELYQRSDMIIKVKEPLPEEYDFLKESQILYTFLHLAAEPELTRILCKKKIKSIAYETIEDEKGGLPLLKPMSQIAGRMATQVGAFYLQKDHGGKGILLGGATGVPPAKVCILGAGIVGSNATKIALGLGAQVTLLDINIEKLEQLENVLSGRCHFLYSNEENIERSVQEADLVIGAVLITGKRAPTLVSQNMIKKMSLGSVVVDVAVDQGGCIETCRPTSHDKPTYTLNGIIHYCVPNMPGVVARTSTYALTNATMQYASLLATYGVEKAIEKNQELSKGLNTYQGQICYQPVAQDLKQPYSPYESIRI